MTATRLLVLGVVRASGQVHGYQARLELISWGAEEWANIKPGSIYHALRQLLKNGMLRSAGVQGSEEGPERTLYELTDDGEAEFARLVHKALSDADVKPELFGAGISFMPTLSRATAVTLLRHRLARLEGQRAELRSLMQDDRPAGKPAHIWELFQWWATEARAACDFTQGMIERLEKGAYDMADDVDVPFGANPASAGPD